MTLGRIFRGKSAMISTANFTSANLPASTLHTSHNSSLLLIRLHEVRKTAEAIEINWIFIKWW